MRGMLTTSALIGERLQFGHRLIDLAIGGYPEIDDGLARVGEGQRRDLGDVAVQPGRLHDVHRDVVDPLLQEHSWQAQPDHRVPAASAVCSGVPLDEPIERPRRRVAEVSGDVDVLHGDDSTRAGQAHHGGQSRCRVRKMREEEPGKDEVEPLVDLRIAGLGIDGTELDVGAAGRRRLLAGDFELGDVHVDPDDRGRGRQLGQPDRDVPAAAADIEAAPTCGYAETREQRVGRRADDAAEHTEASPPRGPPRITYWSSKFDMHSGLPEPIRRTSVSS